MAAGDLRTELAVTAARLIAEEGCEYAQAKRRAVQEILGEDARRRLQAVVALPGEELAPAAAVVKLDVAVGRIRQ